MLVSLKQPLVGYYNYCLSPYSTSSSSSSSSSAWPAPTPKALQEDLARLGQDHGYLNQNGSKPEQTDGWMRAVPEQPSRHLPCNAM